ncbi:DUF1071 domain-containing protein [Ligilactobacillus saerimneri]|uniref:Sak single strand annealing protein n=1 Tax=Ligilactobacillus saerimneri TaxID=228229 RepID=UPI000413F9CF|nr:DUF1071 domain-containing protein [Ligilactobacillus saerimneri]
MSEKKITKKEIFDTLSKIDVSGFVREIRSKNPNKRPLKYLSWPHAVGLLAKHYSNIEGPVWEEYPEMILLQGQYQLTGRNVPYLTTPKGTMVTCTMTVEGNEYSESLYVMDYRNNAIINPDMGEINKAQKRCLAKCIAEMGLGLNIYANEDLPVGDLYEEKETKQEPSKVNKGKYTKERANGSQNGSNGAINQNLRNELNGMFHSLQSAFPEAGNEAIIKNIMKRAFNNEGYKMQNDNDYKKAIATANEMLGEVGYVEEVSLDGQGQPA